MKYLKSYMGVSSGSFMGRDDGYPEMKFRTYGSIDELSRDFGKEKEEKYYELVKLDENALKEKALEALEKQEQERIAKAKENIQKQIDELQKQLNELP